MEGQMLSLFDDEEYKVPQAPKKKTKELLKDVPEAELEEPESADDLTEELLPEDEATEESKTEEIIENEEPEMEATTSENEPFIEPVLEKDVPNELSANTVNIAIELPEPESKPTVTDIEITIPVADKSIPAPNSNALDALYETAITENDYFASLTSVSKPTKQEVNNDKVDRTDLEEEINISVEPNVDPLPEWNLENKYYPIGEVASLFNVNTSHIRFWTTEFKLKTRTTRKGDRLYNPNDIEQLRLIYDLVKVKKYTLKGAKEKLRHNKSGVATNITLKESLLSLKSSLTEILKKLD